MMKVWLVFYCNQQEAVNSGRKQICHLLATNLKRCFSDYNSLFTQNKGFLFSPCAVKGVALFGMIVTVMQCPGFMEKSTKKQSICKQQFTDRTPYV